MAIPKKIKLGGHSIKIRTAKKILDDNKNELSGCYDDDKNTITLDSGLKNSVLLSVFLHELMHAIDIKYMIGLGEKKVQLMAEILLGIYKDNKKELELLFKESENVN